MHLVEVDKEFIKKTVVWWQGNVYATHDDIFRVEAFRKLDPDTATHGEVSLAYGGNGWANLNPCVECGDVEMPHIKMNTVEVCVGCIAEAADIAFPKEPAESKKKSIFQFWK
jgi:hypothetical protein